MQSNAGASLQTCVSIHQGTDQRLAPAEDAVNRDPQPIIINNIV